MSNFSVFLFVCLSVGFTKKFLPANTTPRRVAANQSTHSYVNSLWSCWNAQLLSTYLHDAPFGLRNIHFWQVLKRKVLSHQRKIAWGECFTKSYWNGRKQQLIILLTEFQTDKKYKWLICSVTSPILKRIFLICFLDCKFRVTLFRQVDSFSATYNVLLLPATESGILFSSKNKFINEQRRILSNSVSKQAPTLLGTSLKILKYSKDKLTTENKWKFSKLHPCYISLVRSMVIQGLYIR